MFFIQLRGRFARVFSSLNWCWNSSNSLRLGTVTGEIDRRGWVPVALAAVVSCCASFNVLTRVIFWHCKSDKWHLFHVSSRPRRWPLEVREIRCLILVSVHRLTRILPSLREFLQSLLRFLQLKLHRLWFWKKEKRKQLH
jgi:hypothetical protein